MYKGESFAWEGYFWGGDMQCWCLRVLLFCECYCNAIVSKDCDVMWTRLERH